jgi:hypothetical protein
MDLFAPIVGEKEQHPNFRSLYGGVLTGIKGPNSATEK